MQTLLEPEIERILLRTEPAGGCSFPGALQMVPDLPDAPLLGRLDLAGIVKLSPMTALQRAGRLLRQVKKRNCVANKLSAEDRLGSRAAKRALTLVRRLPRSVGFAPETRGRPLLWHPSPNTREAPLTCHSTALHTTRRRASFEQGVC